MLKRINDIINQVNVFVLIFLSLVMSGSVFIQIVARNIFNSSFEQFEELPRFLLIWITFLGSAMVFRNAGHLGVEFFVKILPKKARLITDMLAHISNTMFILILIFVGGNISVLTMVQRSIQLNVPVGFVYMALPIAGIMMLLIEFERVLVTFRSMKKMLV